MVQEIKHIEEQEAIEALSLDDTAYSGVSKEHRKVAVDACLNQLKIKNEIILLKEELEMAMHNEKVCQENKMCEMWKYWSIKIELLMNTIARLERIVGYVVYESNLQYN